MSVAEERVVRDSVRRAREVVGLYGDPTATWGIGLELLFEAPVDVAGADLRLADLVARHPHLARPPRVEVVADESWRGRRERALADAFGDDGHLVRVLASADHRRIFVAVHHGACDGFGMLAIAEEVAQAGLRPHARGLGTRASTRSFLVSGVLRVLEALFRPPLRVRGHGATDVAGDRVDLATTRPLKVGSAEICCAFAQTYDGWPRRGAPGRRRLLVMLGASRREQGTMAPDRQTGFLRLPLRPGETPEEARRRLAEIPPEPDFPETSAGGVGPLVTRVLRNRLGATATLSNLGLVTGAGLESVAVYPNINGPHAVGMGVVSTPQATTVTLRVRRAEFSQEESDRLLAQMRQNLEALASSSTPTRQPQ